MISHEITKGGFKVMFETSWQRITRRTAPAAGGCTFDEPLSPGRFEQWPVTPSIERVTTWFVVRAVLGVSEFLSCEKWSTSMQSNIFSSGWTMEDVFEISQKDPACTMCDVRTSSKPYAWSNRILTAMELLHVPTWFHVTTGYPPN